MSVAALLLINGCVHMLACFKIREYVPGVVTGVLLYMPLAVWGYARFVRAGELNARGMLDSAVWGAAYQLVPLGYLTVASSVRQRAESGRG